MTFNTNRNNIKPILRGITFVVMVMFCLFWALRAFQSIRAKQIASSNSVINSIYGFDFFRISTFSASISNFILFAIIIVVFSTYSFFCFLVTLLCSPMLFFTFLALSVLLTTSPAKDLVSIFLSTVFIELRQRFYLVALRTSFGYDLLRHNCFSIKQLCSGPVLGYIPTSGSFYYTGASL